MTMMLDPSFAAAWASTAPYHFAFVMLELSAVEQEALYSHTLAALCMHAPLDGICFFTLASGFVGMYRSVRGG